MLIVVFAFVTFVVCAFFDWYIHSKYVMHSKKKLVRFLEYLRLGHPEHHIDFPPRRYKNPEHPSGNVHLPGWAGVLSVGLLTLPVLPLAIYVHRLGIVVSVIVVSTLYFLTHNYVHSCYHVPKGRWFEKTKLFARMDAMHRLHHVTSRNGEPVNIAVACFLFDRIMGTAMFPKTQSHR